MTVQSVDRYGNLREPAYPTAYAQERIESLDKFQPAYAPHRIAETDKEEEG